MTEDPLENLVFEALERMELEGSAALESVVMAHPEHAMALRRRFGALAGMGLVPEDAEPSLEVPSKLGPYSVEGVLGEGGMGLVVAAQDEALDRPVAIKFIRPEFLGSSSMHERFRREVDSVAQLQHPGIVRIFEVGEEAGLSYLAMERIQGCTLQAALRALRERDPRSLTGIDLHRTVVELSTMVSPLDSPQGAHSNGVPPLYDGPWTDVCARIVRDVAEALAAAHRARILHRDIKASNVMITPLGRVVLLDFGLAEIEGAAALTRGSAPVGSLPYTAPERLQIRKEGGRATRASDVYSLGVLLHELLTLRLPFRAATPEDLSWDIRLYDPPPLAAAGVTEPLASLCRRILRKDPARRPPSAEAVAQDITSVLGGRMPRPFGDGPLAALASRWRAAPRVATALAASVALVIGTPATVLLVRAQAAEKTAAADRLSLQRLGSMFTAMDELEAALPDSPALAGTELETLRLDLLGSLENWRAELASDSRLTGMGGAPLATPPDLALVQRAETILEGLSRSDGPLPIPKSAVEETTQGLRSIEDSTHFAFEVRFALARLARVRAKALALSGQGEEALAARRESKIRFEALSAALPESAVLADAVESLEAELNQPAGER